MTGGTSLTDTVLEITPRAQEKILAIRNAEPDADELALALRISGVSGIEFTYEMAMLRVDSVPAEHVEYHGGLPVVIAADSIDRLRGATLDVSRDLLNPGLTIDNPNSPSPSIPTGGAEVTGPLADRVNQLLAHQINPAIASHGGVAELAGVEDGTVYLRLGGGCQGCGMAAVTLRQGIERSLREAIPEIVAVVDVTDHASGENPYYEAAKK